MGRIFQKVVLIKTIFFPSCPILASKSTYKIGIGNQPWRPRIHPLLSQKRTWEPETLPYTSSMYFVQGVLCGTEVGRGGGMREKFWSKQMT
jgi:hypothetical protein